MTFHVVGRKIMQHGSHIGVAGERDVETIQFVLPRRYGGVDLAAGEPLVLYENERGQAGAARLAAMSSPDRLVLAWTVGVEAAAVPGRLEARIAVTGGEDAWLFSTETTVFHVAGGLTGDAGMVMPPDMVIALMALVEGSGALINGAGFDRENHAVTLHRYDGGEISVPIPRPELEAEIIH